MLPVRGVTCRGRCGSVRSWRDPRELTTIAVVRCLCVDLCDLRAGLNHQLGLEGPLGQTAAPSNGRVRRTVRVRSAVRPRPIQYAA